MPKEPRYDDVYAEGMTYLDELSKPPEDRSCLACGGKLSLDGKTCAKCGAPLPMEPDELEGNE